MAQEEEPAAPMTLKERMAMLQSNGGMTKVGMQPTSKPAAPQASLPGKKPPPPVPSRPSLPERPASAVSSLGQNGTNGIGNQPAQARGRPPPPPSQTMNKAVLPAPVMKKWENKEVVKSPELPPRRPSGPTLPARRPSEQSSLSRKQSVESISSIASGRSSISAMSIGANGSSQRSQSRGRALPPVYDPASLPPLPEKKVPVEEQAGPRVPLRPTASATNVKANGSGPPPLPGRPSLPPRTNTAASTNSAQSPALPGRPKRSALEMGFNNKATEAPAVPSSRPNGFDSSSLKNGFGSIKNAISSKMNGNQPTPEPTPPQHVPSYDGSSDTARGDSPGIVVELTAANFDELVVRSGHWVFVDCYAYFCKCKLPRALPGCSLLTSA